MANLPGDGLSPEEFLESFLQSPLPETIPELEEQIALLQQIQDQCEGVLRDLMSREDVEQGIVYAQEIHGLRQQKNMLETHKEYRKVRMRRLLSEQELAQATLLSGSDTSQ